MFQDPAISSEQPPGTYPPFDDGAQMDVFVKNDTGSILIGQVKLHVAIHNILLYLACNFMACIVPGSYLLNIVLLRF